MYSNSVSIALLNYGRLLKEEQHKPCSWLAEPGLGAFLGYCKFLRLQLPSSMYTGLQQHDPDLIGWHFGTGPVVDVVLEIPVAESKLELLEKIVVVHEV